MIKVSFECIQLIGMFTEFQKKFAIVMFLIINLLKTYHLTNNRKLYFFEGLRTHFKNAEQPYFNKIYLVAHPSDIQR